MKVHVLIWGDLLNRRSLTLPAWPLVQLAWRVSIINLRERNR
uniref:Uncharacterized protein n=2 Tax=Vibrio TaxID=662 RepID=A0A0H3ZZ54_VIBSP|nr:hypothetical protein [Vibrio genomosp. F6]AKN39174.1 hypothetical protein [Vibrio splendidus]